MIQSIAPDAALAYAAGERAARPTEPEPTRPTTTRVYVAELNLAGRCFTIEALVTHDETDVIRATVKVYEWTNPPGFDCEIRRQRDLSIVQRTHIYEAICERVFGDKPSDPCDHAEPSWVADDVWVATLAQVWTPARAARAANC